MQCLVNTSDLPRTLWQSFPAVPCPPQYAEHEPLSEFVAQSVAKPQAGAKAAAVATLGNVTDNTSVPAKSEAADGVSSVAAPTHENGDGPAADRVPSASSLSATPRNSTDEGSAAGSVVIKEASFLPASTGSS